LFHPMADTMSVALVGALVLTLTFVPVMCSYWFKNGVREKRNKAFEWTKDRYAGYLTWCLDRPKFTIFVASVIFGATLLLIPFIGGEFMPHLDEGALWVRAMANPIAPVLVEKAPCQEVVQTGAELLASGLASLPIPISTPGFDSAPYLTATLCVTKDPDNGIQNMGTYRAALKANDRLGVRMASRLSGAGGYLHWKKYKKLGQPMPCAIVVGCAPAVLFTGPQKLPIDVECLTSDLVAALAARLRPRPRILHVDDDRDVVAIVAHELNPITDVVSADSVERASYAGDWSH